jgi:predicted RNA-binding protein with PIN domain
LARILIDGYNLLFRDADPGRVRLEDARDDLLRRIDAARLPGDSIVVVFDGRSGHSAAGSRREGLAVRFSQAPGSADDVIASAVAAARRGEVTVVTRDRGLQGRVRAAGGKLMDPERFFDPARRAPRRGPAPSEKPDAPTGWEVDEWERLFGGDEPE